MDAPPLNMLVIYARDVRKTAEFYTRFFGFERIDAADEDGDAGVIELRSSNGGAHLLIHRAAKSVKLGQVGVKLVFAVEDVEAFKKRCATLGLEFGSTHHADGYSFANAKDPDKNSVSISSRAFRQESNRLTVTRRYRGDADADADAWPNVFAKSGFAMSQ
jgi:catechol 2,3-dioxygenase-like lactoylglutathione lyase family enzyme